MAVAQCAACREELPEGARVVLVTTITKVADNEWKGVEQTFVCNGQCASLVIADALHQDKSVSFQNYRILSRTEAVKRIMGGVTA